MGFVTARICPIDAESGIFQSEVVEAAYQVAAEYGLTRLQFQRVMQCHNAAEDKARFQYQDAVAKRKEEAKATQRQFTVYILNADQCGIKAPAATPRDAINQVLEMIDPIAEMFAGEVKAHVVEWTGSAGGPYDHYYHATPNGNDWDVVYTDKLPENKLP